MEELEPRLLLSADAASVLGATAALQDADLQSAAPLVASDATQGTEAPATEVQRRELIIIDPATPDYQRLLAELGTEAADGTEREVVLLRPGEDGVAQISDILSRYTDLSAIHLISHGADGEILLGNGVLDLDGVLANARAIQDWGQALAADGDLLIYGCNVAADGVGQTLIDTLSRLTCADVAASDDVTGSPNLGADWDLEYAAGNVETSIAVNARLQQNWHGLLAAPVAVSDAYAVNEDSTLIVAPSTSNLSHWWKLDEGGSSQTAADSGSLANSGTLGSTAGVDAADPAWTTGYVGGAALDFDGTSDYVATTSTELKTASQFTLSAWFQTDITTGAHHILWQGYTGGNGYGNGGSTSPATSEMSLSIGSFNASYDNKIVFFLGYDVPPTTANSIFIASASNFTDTAGWHHVAVTVADVGGGVMSASLYIDGKLEGSDTGTENDRSIWNALRIGAPDAAQRFFDGRIDEVRVYQTALSAPQVQAIAQAGVLQNDTDADGDELTVNRTPVAGPTNGVLVLNSDGSFSYTPNPNFAGIDAFTYEVSDGNGGSAQATVTINVTAVNDAPAGADRTVTTLEDAAYTFAASDFGFTDPIDSPANALLGVKISTLPGTGTLTNNGAAVTAGQTISLTDINLNRLAFTPAANANGAGYASFTFQVQDDGGTGNGGVDLDATPNTITVNVTAVNDAPLLAAIEGAALSYTENAAAIAITATLTLSDPDNANLASATIQITGNYVNGEDVLSFTNTAGITGNWNAVSGTLTLTGSDTVANYQAALRAVRYVNTSDNPSTLARTVSFIANDGTANSNTVTRNITVTAVNDPPVTTPVTLTAIAEDSGARLITQAELLANATDVDGPSLTATSLAISSGLGSLVNNGDGTWTFTPALNDDTGVSFSYTVTDGSLSAAGSATLDITPVNDAPVTTPVTLTAIASSRPRCAAMQPSS